MKSLTEEEQSKSTQRFVNFSKCPPGRKAVLKQLPKQGLKAKLPRSSPPHRHKSWNANVTGREKWKLQINKRARLPHCPCFKSILLCWQTLLKDHFSEMRICREHRSANPRTAMGIRVNLQTGLIQALQNSHRHESCCHCQFTNFCCFPYCQEHRAVF